MKSVNQALSILILAAVPTFGCSHGDSLSQSLSLDERLRLHVHTLAADSMEGRGIQTEGIGRAAAYIEMQMNALGFQPMDPWGRFDSFDGPEGSTLKNILGIISPAHQDSSWILITAHYDHLGLTETEEGLTEAFNGAHDNASGVAVALEAGRILSQGRGGDAGVALILFSAEEEGLVGSRHFVADLLERDVHVRAVINIDAVGHLADRTLLLVGMQGQPSLNRYMDDASNIHDLSTVHAALSYASGDHAPFLEAGIPAIQITTGPHILMNTILDDPESLNYEGMAQVCSLVCTMASALSSPGISLEAPPQPLSRSSFSRKRVRFGIIPDFTYSLPGVKAQGITPDSPAEAAGLTAGDVVYGLGMMEIEDLKGLADALRHHGHGDSVVVFYRRSGIAEQTTAVLEGR